MRPNAFDVKKVNVNFKICLKKVKIKKHGGLGAAGDRREAGMRVRRRRDAAS